MQEQKNNNIAVGITGVLSTISDKVVSQRHKCYFKSGTFNGALIKYA